MPFHIDLDNQ